MSVITLKVNEASWGRQVKAFAEATMLSLADALVLQGRLYSHELIQMTPPFSGKAIRRMLAAKELKGSGLVGKEMKKAVMERSKTVHLKDPEIDQASAYAIGRRRVERDIRKVIYGVKNPPSPQAAEVRVGQSERKVYSKPAISDWGVYQKCQGKDAIRIFATKKGIVYGIDTEKFLPNATHEQLAVTHNTQRGKRGRVTTAGGGSEGGDKNLVVGRWRWVNRAVTREAAVAAYVKRVQKGVGNAKGGWAHAYMALGGRMSRNGWIGRHHRAGDCRVSLGGPRKEITIINHSRWASGGDTERIMERALEGRIRDIQIDIDGRMRGLWGPTVEKTEVKFES